MTNSYMIATCKKTFSTTVFKASNTFFYYKKSKKLIRLNSCYYYRDLY